MVPYPMCFASALLSQWLQAGWRNLPHSFRNMVVAVVVKSNGKQFEAMRARLQTTPSQHVQQQSDSQLKDIIERTMVAQLQYFSEVGF